MQGKFNLEHHMEADIFYAFCHTLRNMYADHMRDARKWSEKRVFVIDHIQFDG